MFQIICFPRVFLTLKQKCMSSGDYKVMLKPIYFVLVHFPFSPICYHWLARYTLLYI